MKIKNTIDPKFDTIPVEKDTRIISREQVKVGPYDAVLENWVWEGIIAKSYIFYNDNIEGVSQKELLALAGKPDATYSRGETYTLVNFDFEAPC